MLDDKFESLEQWLGSAYFAEEWGREGLAHIHLDDIEVSTLDQAIQHLQNASAVELPEGTALTLTINLEEHYNLTGSPSEVFEKMEGDYAVAPIRAAPLGEQRLYLPLSCPGVKLYYSVADIGIFVRRLKVVLDD